MRRGALVEANGVLNAADATLGIDKKDIETDAVGPPGWIFGKEDFGGCQEPGLLAGSQGLGGHGEGGTGFDFDEGEQAVLFGDGIDLAGFGAEATAEDPPAICGERVACTLFSGKTEGGVCHDAMG